MIDQIVIEGILGAYKYDAVNLLQILLNVQSVEAENYISEEVATYIAHRVHVPLSRVYEVVTYYSVLSHKPQGKYIIQICNTTVCKLNGFNEVLEWFKETLKVDVGETTSDGLFTLKLTSCIGACDVSPAVKIGHKVYGHIDEAKVQRIIDALRGYAQ
ncbi:NAD(P)H-dependent oxidoreductase subunit E [Fusibacter sp. 3D3]|uniref:NADH-quinone oxidoreductase subunit NuoE family protein n=1 Tax=Fusibacter sp. 3D3 TaxID=1048380 RepID=UPI000852ED4B|nr:NAD(P)H-dependent oxidoreductase subunit E [Fusibacter sp. 3D3]GAU76824.1 NADP-reducing hydrogenase subunit A [Fusibacter sp. 3D3]